MRVATEMTCRHTVAWIDGRTVNAVPSGRAPQSLGESWLNLVRGEDPMRGGLAKVLRFNFIFDFPEYGSPLGLSGGEQVPDRLARSEGDVREAGGKPEALM